MLRIALTGGIASGKTRVSDLFAARGVPVIDADVAAREVVAPGSQGLQALITSFGTGILAADGTLDRRALRERIFADEAARARVNALLHPLIRARMHELSAAQPAPYQLFVIPLLAETGQAADYDAVLLVDADRETRIARLMQRDQVNRDQAEAALQAQADDASRRTIATDIIDNSASIAKNGDEAGLQAQVESCHQKFLALAQSRTNR